MASADASELDLEDKHQLIEGRRIGGSLKDPYMRFRLSTDDLGPDEDEGQGKSEQEKDPVPINPVSQNVQSSATETLNFFRRRPEKGAKKCEEFQVELLRHQGELERDLKSALFKLPPTFDEIKSGRRVGLPTFDKLGTSLLILRSI